MMLALLAVLAMATTLPAVADIEVGHAGNVGDHQVVDSQSAPGATCRFAPPLVWSMGETWIQVRPPLLFARDATTLDDEQLVGWRAVILGEDRASGLLMPIATGQTQRAVAAEDIPAPFESRGPETQFHLGYGAYRVHVELFWYERLNSGGEPRLAGQAEYEIEHYAIVIRHRSGIRQSGVSGTCQLEV